uniref:Ribosomal protein L5 n=1 Tax=Amorphochlora amoebiformis TaxID=1561963 RepID=A0A0H5BKM0_9EUKA|nr:ribosomal protein L5 [Amorphochlora amoebiformis]
MITKVQKNSSYFSRFLVKYRRNRENKTNYKKKSKKNQYNYLKSKRNILICFYRISNFFVNCSLKYISLIGDVSIQLTDSKSLSFFGWVGNLKNTISNYLLGCLFSKNVTYYFSLFNKLAYISSIDLGYKNFSLQGRIFFFMKGLCDNGIQMPYNVKSIASYEKRCEIKNPLISNSEAILWNVIHNNTVIEYNPHSFQMFNHIVKTYRNISKYFFIIGKDSRLTTSKGIFKSKKSNLKSYKRVILWKFIKYNQMEQKLKYLGRIIKIFHKAV